MFLYFIEPPVISSSEIRKNMNYKEWTGFYMISASVMKGLNLWISLISYFLLKINGNHKTFLPISKNIFKNDKDAKQERQKINSDVQTGTVPHETGIGFLFYNINLTYRKNVPLVWKALFFQFNLFSLVLPW